MPNARCTAVSCVGEKLAATSGGTRARKRDINPSSGGRDSVRLMYPFLDIRGCGSINRGRLPDLRWPARMGVMQTSPPDEILSALARMGLLPPGEKVAGEPLTGGVSSDIWRIDLPSGPVCVKRALAKLRVAADWRGRGWRQLSEGARGGPGRARA